MIIFEAIMFILCWGLLIAIISCEETYCFFRKMWLDVRLFAALTAFAVYIKIKNFFKNEK